MASFCSSGRVNLTSSTFWVPWTASSIRSKRRGAGGLPAEGGRKQLAALEVDKEPGLCGGTPAMIHTEQGGRWCVDQLQHGRPVKHYVGFLDTRDAGFRSELEAGLQFVAPTAPLFFVAGDSLAAADTNVGHFQKHRQLTVLSIKAGLAGGAKVQRGVAERSTRAAEPFLAAAFIETTWRRPKADNFPLRTLMVQDVAGTELAEGKEAWTADELTVASRHPGRTGKAGKL